MIDLTTRLAELKAVAEGVPTEGFGSAPWTHQHWGQQNQNGDYAQPRLFDSIGESLADAGWPDEVGDHIATFDPPTILALIAALEGVVAHADAIDDLAATPVGTGEAGSALRLSARSIRRVITDALGVRDRLVWAKAPANPYR